MASAVNHVGLCVTDIARSRRFYEEALGFTFQRDLRAPDAFTVPLLGLDPPVGLTAVYLTLGTFILELLHYERPDNPPSRRRSFNDPGLTHLSLTVDDLPATLQRVRDLGGAVVESSDLQIAIMIRDPDGQLIELLTTAPG